MSDVSAILNELEAKDIIVDVADGSLVLRGPLKRLSAAERRLITDQKERLVEELEAASVSDSQQRQWLLHQLDPSTCAYNVPLVFAVDGALDVERFKRAVQAVAERHEALRTSYFAEAGRLRARPITKVDVAIDLKRAKGGAQTKELVDELVGQPFQPERPPHLRGRVILHGERQATVALVTNHLVVDGWASRVLVAELIALYRGDQPKQPSSFFRYVRAKNRRRADPDLARRWREHLDGLPAAPELPKESCGSVTDCRVTRIVSKADVEQLLRAAGRYKTTPLGYCLGALGVALRDYASDGGLVVAVGVSNRDDSITHTMVGPLSNILPIGIPCSPSLTPTEFLETITRNLGTALALVDYPFERAWRDWAVEGTFPPTAVMLTLQNAPTASFDLAGVTLSSAEYSWQSSRVPLGFQVSQRPNGWHLELEYDGASLAASTAQRILDNFSGALRRLADVDGKQQLAAIAVAPASSAILTGPQCAPFVSVIQMIEAVSQELSDAVAVEVEGATSLTYGELVSWSRSVACDLRRRDIGREDVVGVATSRSPAAVASMLGVLMVGAAFLPLDMSYPLDRLDHIAADSGLCAAITDLDEFPLSVPTTIRLSTIGRDQKALDPAVEHFEELLAYVIYTSGSTGKPKGVELTHRGLSNLVTAQREGFTILRGTRVLQFAKMSFDAFVSEVFVTLCAGGTLVMAKPEVILPGPPLALTLQRLGIDVATLPASTLAVTDAAPNTMLATLVSAGERVPSTVVRRWRPFVKRFINAYGPTETTVCTTMGVVDNEADADPSVGGPLSGIKTIVQRDDGRPVAPGQVGELVVGGIALARGYRGRPGLTADRFRPFAEGPAGSRCYHTGDLFQANDRGLLFTGRNDEQLKISGYRVEPGEVEAAIRAIDGVRDVAVVAQQVGAHKSLSCFFVGGISERDLRQQLEAKLPDYLRPRRCTQLAELPKSPAGKVDRVALVNRTSTTPERRLVLTARVARVCAVFERVLHSAVSAETNFFDAGGHSLLAVELVRQLNAELSCNLTIAHIMGAATPIEVSRLLDHGLGPGAGLTVLSAGNGPPIVLFPALGGDIQVYRDLIRLLDDRLVVTPPLVPPLDGDALKFSGRIAADLPPNPILVGWSVGGWYAWYVAAALEQLGARARSVILLDTWDPSSLAPIADATVEQLARSAAASLAISMSAAAAFIESQLLGIQQYNAPRLETPVVAVTTANTPVSTLGYWRGRARTFHHLAVDANHRSILAEPHHAVVLRAIDWGAGEQPRL